MSGRSIKCNITPDGRLFIVDPGLDCLGLIKKLWPDFRLQSVSPSPGFVPSFQRTRRIFMPEIAPDKLPILDTARLWELHERALKEGIESRYSNNGVSLLDLKIELARRELQRCGLCGWQCGVNRFKEKGRCGLGPDAYYDEPFVHVAEEAVITPCAMIRLAGCALTCVFCQARESCAPQPLKQLGSGLWDALASDEYFPRAAALEFGGGNPDESACAILEALAAAPGSLRLPVVMNDNGYASPVLYRLLDGVVDVWLTDFKYGNDACGRKLSGVGNYVEVAEEGLRQMCGQKAKTIVRMLVLPGHVECCHEKTLEKLAVFRGKIWLSIIDSYVPDWKARNHPDLNRLVSEGEIVRLRESARSHGLRDVAEAGEEFWKGE